MQNQPSPVEAAAFRRGSILLIATLMATSPAWSEKEAFDRAENIQEEAENRGYDLRSIVTLVQTDEANVHNGRTLREWCGLFGQQDDDLIADAERINALAGTTGLKVYPDGNAWMCRHTADDPEPDAQVGCGDTPHAALGNWREVYGPKDPGVGQ